MRLTRAATLIAVLAAAACARRRAQPPLPPGSTQQSLRTGGHGRTYVLHVPPRYDGRAPMPLLVLLHGFGGDGRRMEEGTHFSALADTAGLIVAYPDGLRTYGFAGPRHWASSGTDETDVDFIRALIDDIAKRYRVSTARIYVAGFSNGAMMTYRIGAELSDKLAAIGVVAGAIGRRSSNGQTVTIPAPARPLSVVAMHGRLDPTVPYDASLRSGRMRGVLSVAAAMAFWREHDGCSAPPAHDTMNAGNVIAERSIACAGGTELLYYTVEDGTHAWFMPHPDSSGTVSAAHAISATDLLWRFFATQAK